MKISAATIWPQANLPRFASRIITQPPRQDAFIRFGASDRDRFSDAIITVMDLETTGFGSSADLLEVTAIRYQNGVELGKYTSLIKPSGPIPERITELTGITDDMVRKAPPPAQVLAELIAFVGPNARIAGHNIGFDLRFLAKRFEQFNITPPACFDTKSGLDTLALARRLLPHLPDHHGTTVGAALGIANPQAHRSEADVRMTAAILYALVQKAVAQGIPMHTIGDVRNYQASPIQKTA
jgi:DNA polymerase III epsilon subunit-like protein